MSSTSDSSCAGHGSELPSILGHHKGQRPGPLVVFFGGIHGNEFSGIAALEQVFSTLKGLSCPFYGQLLGVVGNRPALEKQQRFMTRDLNRKWSSDAISRLLSSDPQLDSPEDREQRRLLKVLAPLLASAREPIIFVDLHSTSGHGAPFSCMADVIRNRKIAFKVPIPVVLGLEEVIDGSLIGYLCDLGHIGVAIEGGQHTAPQTTQNHIAAVWHVLVAAGCLKVQEVPGFAEQQRRLHAASQNLDRVLEIRHRHVVGEEDEFEMVPGFSNFQEVKKNQLVAHDRHGEICTPEAGIMMLPRYQGLGEDGYFLARSVSSFRLELSANLRRIYADRLIPFFPGVTRHPEKPDHIVLHAQMNPLQVMDVLHLFGYRRRRQWGDGYVFSRRRPDFHAIDGVPHELKHLVEG